MAAVDAIETVVAPAATSSAVLKPVLMAEVTEHIMNVQAAGSSSAAAAVITCTSPLFFSDGCCC